MSTLRELGEALQQADLLDDVPKMLDASRSIEADPLEAELPWYLRVVVGAGAWLTAFFLLFWIGFVIVCFAGLNDGGVLLVVSFLLGISSLALSMGTAWWPEVVRLGRERRLADEDDALPARGRMVLFGRTVGLDFLGQMGVVGVLAGQGGFAIGLADVVRNEELIYAVLIAQSLCLLTSPHFALRFLSAAGVGMWAMLLEDELFDTRGLTMAIATVALVAIWMARPLWLRTRAWAAHAPIGHGLAAFVLLGHVVANEMISQPFVNGLAAVVVVRTLLHEARVGALGQVLGVVLAVAAAALTAPVPGVILSLIVLGLGARARDVVLQGSAVLGLLGYGVYDTIVWDVNHRERFLILLGLGLGFLIAAKLLDRLDPTAAPEGT
ncbi:MAG: DUF4401 domain-containing protein [Proteobacteria bacterium]|nr:DUF4401 domain-containing protein [Pseudomonadota bacterium]